MNARHAMGLTRATGVGRPTVTRIEGGRRRKVGGRSQSRIGLRNLNLLQWSAAAPLTLFASFHRLCLGNSTG
jgi:hypothetical protein